ncbi:MAG: ABC transporter substrate-binding protein [Thermodesulfobacteriota bacterium]
MTKSPRKNFEVSSSRFWFTMKRLSVGIAFIALSSSILLVSDWNRRKPSVKRIPHVAMMQHASQAILDEGVQGMIDGLAEGGFIDGESIVIRRYNAENDVPTANAIAKEITGGQFDLVLTTSTLSLQAVASANKAGKTIHVFGLVSDPFGAGVGINRENPTDHPRHLVGIGTMQPVAEAFRLAKTLFPGLKTVGVVWNPAESNSEANTLIARDICQELGIKLVEANVDSSSGVFEAASSLVARGAQALWVGGDLTVNVAIDSVLAAARKGRIPVFTNIPPNAKRGALFDLGPNYYEVGRLTGELAAEILRGADPATISVKNVVPEKLVINRLALDGLKDPWPLPQDVRIHADILIDEAGVHEKSVATIIKPPAGRVFRIGLVYFAPEPGAEACMDGLFNGLRDLGFVEGKNLEVRKAHAQGEIVNIPSILQNFDSQNLELIISMTTPCLTAACSVVRDTPVVFTYVYDPIAAGAGKSFTEHLPNVTGVGSFPPIEDTIDVIKKLVPNVRSVGTLYNSSEANSRKVISVARELFHKQGIKLEEVTVTTTNEVFQAVQALGTRKIEALWITGDNTALQAFEGIAKIAAELRLPLIINDPEFTERGALVAVGIGWYQTGYAASKTVARILLGESPAKIPFENVAVKQVVLNQEVARKLGITFPEELIEEAKQSGEKGIYQTGTKPDVPAPLARKWRVNVIEFNDVLDVEETEQGVVAGLREAGLVEGRDYEVKVQNAQGDMPTVNSMVDAAITQGADLLITMSTPTLQAALQRARNVPIVFTYIASAIAAGAGHSDEDHLPNVTGVYTGGAYDDMIAHIRELLPSVRVIGTLFVPSEVNSVYHKDQLVNVAKKAGIDVVAVPANTNSEVSDAALALSSQKIDAICQIPGNLTASSFPSIVQAAGRFRLPIFAFQSVQAPGSVITLARDYHDAGREAALIAVRVMRGENLGTIPFKPYRSTKIIVNLDAARAAGLTIPSSLIQQAEEVIGKRHGNHEAANR